jgi:hypothetical protein
MNNQIFRHKWVAALVVPATLILASCSTPTPPGGTTANQANSSPAADTTPAAKTATAPSKTTANLGVAPDGKNCPANAPIKAKEGKKGKVYHQPDSSKYERIKPDTCFTDIATAQKAGFKPAKSKE